MARKKKEPEKREYAVPYRVELSGILSVEAESAEEAEKLANAGDWDDDDFYARAELVNWEVTGEVRTTEHWHRERGTTPHKD